jgi:hypothetical protein
MQVTCAQNTLHLPQLDTAVTGGKAMNGSRPREQYSLNQQHDQG